jgi:hypothetical protein
MFDFDQLVESALRPSKGRLNNPSRYRIFDGVLTTIRLQ